MKNLKIEVTKNLFNKCKGEFKMGNASVKYYDNGTKELIYDIYGTKRMEVYYLYKRNFYKDLLKMVFKGVIVVFFAPFLMALGFGIAYGVDKLIQGVL